MIGEHHQLFLKWLILAVVVVFGIAAAGYFNLIQIIISSDVSLISAFIMAIFSIMFVYLGVQTTRVSKELNLTKQIEETITSFDPSKLKYELDEDFVLVCGQKLPDCALTRYIRELILKSKTGKSENLDQQLLLEEYSDSLHEKGTVGWMVSQKMVNLGLLGTAIGFAIALMALFNVTSFDFAAMKSILADVAIGMSIALYTTITALATSIPIEIKSYFIERGNNQLVSLTTKITEVYVVPVLEKENAKKPSRQK